ncbi:hypothetical protein VISI1226_15246 [Vibrio sinaloensis DSM 21326]|uniref:Uncharacterized protein n=1 Tax=Vibrio sinaloensis DSM 21326 TaxID=945550 RepID=E8MCT2_PHOS4|nr:hypothetical protein VISI1226_15246 [Vibrio sinaloensis DSM 21326]
MISVIGDLRVLPDTFDDRQVESTVAMNTTHSVFSHYYQY